MSGGVAEVASRHVVLRDGVRLEIVESVCGAVDRKMDPRDSGDDAPGRTSPPRQSSPSFPRKREPIPLLLLHGFTGAASTWNDLLPAFGARRRAVALSLHGHGGSDVPADPAR
ncbi:MAG TPA: hypothetical protein VFK39_03670, partial [Gemmatimonadaceae bacterium]|nr:hypothetical protein [Gemmatimonadaceae bacterium]